MIALAVESKQCTECGIDKPIGEYNVRHGKGETGERRRGKCKACDSAYVRAKRKARRPPPRVRNEEEKVCSKCEQTKPIDDFAFCELSADGRQNYCRECKKAYTEARESNEPRVCRGCNRMLPAADFPLTDSGRHRSRCALCQSPGKHVARKLPALRVDRYEPPLPEPTAAQPGTPDKVKVLVHRALAGTALFHPRDLSWPCHWPDVVRYCRELTPETERHGVAPRELRRNATG